MSEEQDLQFLIKKVEFQIDESFPESLITVEKPPYEIHNAGYGEFAITITIHFNDPFERPLEYTHQLMFEDQAQQLDNFKNKKSSSAPVVFEKYNEITFFEPTEHFYKTLIENSYKNWVELEHRRLSTVIEPAQPDMQTLQQEVITKASKYQNYLTHNGKPPIVRQQFKGDYK